MKPLRKQFCKKCLEIYRTFENKRRNKYRRLRIKEVGSQEAGKILINKKQK